MNRNWQEAVRILKKYDRRLSNLEEEREQEGSVEQFRDLLETAVSDDEVTVSTRDSAQTYYWDDGSTSDLATWE